MNRSGIYESVVRHQRFKPMGHRLRYGVYSLLVDLDELDATCADISILSRNRFNLVSIHDKDLGPRDGSDLRTWFEKKASEAGVDVDGGRIEILLFPRILGYGFNPITVWLGYGALDELKVVAYEVHNTFGQAHTYVAAVPEHLDQDAIRRLPAHEFDKVFHVSPFFDTDGGYRMTLAPPTDTYSIVIEYFDTTGDKVLTASQVGTRSPLTTWSLLRQFVTKPLLTIKVIGGIHVEAFKVWRKGAKYRPVPSTEPSRVSVAQWDVEATERQTAA